LTLLLSLELSTDTSSIGRARVKQCGARRAVLDSLTSMALGVLPNGASRARLRDDEDFAPWASPPDEHGNAELLGSAQISIRRLVRRDNVIQLKYVEVNGGLDAAFSFEGRGVRHTPKCAR